MTARHESWVSTWKQKSRLPEEKLSRWAWRKVKNGIEVGRRQRQQAEVLVTIVAKRGRGREDLSPRELRVAAFACAKLAAAGHDFDFKVETTDGIVYAYVAVRTLLPVHQQPGLKLVAA
jgi:hypothetical protein